jgi:hypothetical protein
MDTDLNKDMYIETDTDLDMDMDTDKDTHHTDIDTGVD